MLLIRGILLHKRKYSIACVIIVFCWFLFYAIGTTVRVSFRNSHRWIQPDVITHGRPIEFESIHSSSLSTDDVLLVVRTSKSTQHNRMYGIVKTWFQFLPYHTFITTNGNLTFLQKLLPFKYHSQLHASTCQQAHSIRDLCCNSASEFEIYFRSINTYRWLCRFDDDQYVNVPLLVKYLQAFSPDEEPLYIGKPSMKEPKRGGGIQFWFATYGGGVCFSRALLKRIRNDVQPNDRFVQGCMTSHYPDDTFIAYLLRKQYNINLTVAEDFHHHIELGLFTNLTNASTIDRAITLGFKGNNVPRFVPLLRSDFYHIQTLHCLLYPDRHCLQLIRLTLNQLYERAHH
jgi:fringe